MVPREQSSDRPAWVTAAPSGSALGRPEACEPDAHACGQFVSQRSVVRSCSWARARGTGVRPEWHKGAAPRRSPVQLASGRSLPQSAARAGSRGLCSLSVSLPRSPSRLAVRPCLVHPPVCLYVPASFTLPSARTGRRSLANRMSSWGRPSRSPRDPASFPRCALGKLCWGIHPPLLSVCSAAVYFDYGLASVFTAVTSLSASLRRLSGGGAFNASRKSRRDTLPRPRRCPPTLLVT